MVDFVSLHNHSSYSILQALATPKELFHRAKELGQKALAITEYATLSSVWDNYKLGKELGIKFIPGCDFYFTNDNQNQEEKLRTVVLLAQNAEGYKNLLTLHRRGFDHHALILKKVIPVIDWKLLQEYSNGLICLTADGNGIIGQLLNAGQFIEAENTLLKLQSIFGARLGAEIQAHNLNVNATDFRGKVNQIFTNQQVIKLAQKHQIKIIPTSNTHYLNREDAEIHDVQLSIGSMRPVWSNNRMKFNVSDLYLKSGDEIKAFFARNYGEEFAAQICQNTVELAETCEEPKWVAPQYSSGGKKELPVFPVKDQPDYEEFKKWWIDQKDDWKSLEIDQAYLRYLCEQAFSKMVPAGKEKEYRERLEMELDTFNYCGVSSYMLIVADFIDWARKNNIPTGVGRGSSGGSLCGYFLGIHLADSIKYGLVFERFYSKLRTSLADVDNDISKIHRYKLIEYLTQKYGKDNICQISNINTITPKVYVRDLSRSLQLGGSSSSAVEIGDMTADFVPKEAKNIEDAFKNSSLFVEVCKRYSDFTKYRKICNKPRAFSIHAAAVCINHRSIADLLPIRLDKELTPVVEFDKDKSEDAGLVKIDILGIETLDIIALTKQLIKNRGKPEPHIDYNEYDKKTYDLISRGDTLGVFQLGESAAAIDLCRKIQPKSINDLAIITAIVRPVSKNIREDVIKAKDGKLKKKLLHPSLERGLKETFGFPIYDESLLTIAKDVAGWDLAEADKLRKLTKMKGSHPEKAKKWREEFIQGAINKSIPEQTAIQIWSEIIEPFGGYGFNKSHAVFYSFISYETAYLKAHYPLEFLLSNLKSELQSNAPKAEENASKIKAELRKLGNKILPPDVNTSEISYKIQDHNTLLTGLEAAKYLGEDAMEEVLTLRPFSSFYDFMLRTTSKKMRATAIQALAASGALDCFNIPRKILFLYCSDYRKKLQVWLKKHDPSTEQFEYNFPEMNEWSLQERYALEQKYLGEAFVCGKKQAYSGFFDKDPPGNKIPFKIIAKMPNKQFLPTIRGEIKSIFEFKVKKENSKNFGQPMLKAVLEDEFNDQINITFFPDTYQEAQRQLKRFTKNKMGLEPGLAVQLNGSVNIWNDEAGIAVGELMDACLPPALPKDLKTKTISKRTSKKEEKLENNVENLMERIEDDLLDRGLINLDEEDDDLEEYDID